MASVTTNYLSSAPLTDNLEVPSELQRTDDFASVSTSRSTTSLSRTNIDKIDWHRLYGYIATPRLSKRPKSFIWMHGFKIKYIANNQEY
jgi:hypothetical protein